MSDSVIKRLKRKIVLVSIAAVFVSLLALIFAINYAHYLQVDASLHSALAEIASETDTGFDADQRLQGDGSDQQLPKQDVEDDQHVAGQDGVQAPDTELDALKHMEHGGRKSARAQYGSRFFCVLVAEDGSVNVRSRGDGELTDEYARQLVQSALGLGKPEGYLDDYKFLVDESGAQRRVFFLDCTTDLEAL